MDTKNFVLVCTVITITIILQYPSLYQSYKLVSGYAKNINLTCTLPREKHADKLNVSGGSSSFSDTIINITNAGPEVPCYCGDPDKEYKVLLTNVTESDEGKYRCRFSLNGTTTHRENIDLRVIPRVYMYTYSDINNNTYYVCNRTKSIEERNVKLYAKLGSVQVNDKTKGVSYNSTKTEFILGVGDKTDRVLCGISYNGRTEERVMNTLQ
nr:Ig domain protein [Oriental turtle dovepox virus]